MGQSGLDNRLGRLGIGQGHPFAFLLDAGFGQDLLDAFGFLFVQDHGAAEEGEAEAKARRFVRDQRIDAGGDTGEVRPIIQPGE